MPTQTESGKAFEYTIINAIYHNISDSQKVNILQDNAYQITKKCFEVHGEAEKQRYLKASRSAVEHLVTLEPRLLFSSDNNDVITLKIQEDRVGIQGDARDILTIRAEQGWEIGISAKNNSESVRHLRLSDRIDFGNQWFGLPCSKDYFLAIMPIFNRLRQLRVQNLKWQEIEGKETDVYTPLLDAFKNELELINKNHHGVPKKLLQYLIGNKDFYKIIKKHTTVTIQAFNLGRTLGQNAGNKKPPNKITQTPLPNSIIKIKYKDNSNNTIQIFMDEGWALDLRIHNASTRVEPSLKFDIVLTGLPNKLYTHHIPY